MTIQQLSDDFRRLSQMVTSLELVFLIAQYASLERRVSSLETTSSRFAFNGRVISVDGREWIELYSGTVAEVVSENCLRIKPASLNAAGINWPVGKQDPPGNVTSMRQESLGYIQFTLADGSSVIFTGACRLVAGGAWLLQSTEAKKDIYVWFVTDTAEATTQAAADLAAEYPPRFQWPDRRPIGKSFAYRQSGVPRNWLWTWNTQAEFEARYHRHVQSCIDNCHSVDAQGLLLWDVEGQYNGHPISYVGDPEFAHLYAPECTQEFVKGLFRRIVDAGLKPGVCIRPTQIRPVDWNVFGLWQFTLDDDQEYVAELRRKISYAYEELGCRIFYIDSMIRGSDILSPVPAGTSQMIPFELFAGLCAEFSDCLMIPEQINHAWLSICAQFIGGLSAIDPVLKVAYPDAFGFAHGQSAMFPRDTELLRTTVEDGNIGSFNAWYASPDLAAIKDVISNRTATR